MQTINSRDLTLVDLQTRFNLQISTEESFFPEWQSFEVTVTLAEQEKLNRINQNFSSLLERKALSEQTIKLVVIAPLLDLAGFYNSPYSISAEDPIEIISEDENIKIKGKIDVLVINDKLWVLIIESKSSSFNPRVGLPQLLSYLLASLRKAKDNAPVYGLLTNGQQFQFVKVVNHPIPTYTLSRVLSIDFPPDDFPKVLEILRCLTKNSNESFLRSNSIYKPNNH